MRDASHTCQHTVVAYLLLSQMSAFPAIKITQTAHRRSGYSLHNDLHTDNILVSWPLFYDPLQFKPKQSLLKQMKKVCALWKDLLQFLKHLPNQFCSHTFAKEKKIYACQKKIYKNVLCNFIQVAQNLTVSICISREGNV